MTTTTRNAKIAELESLIENLQAELDACPNRLWQSEGNQQRLTLLVAYTAKLRAIESESAIDDVAGVVEPDWTDEDAFGHPYPPEDFSTEHRPMTHDEDSFLDAYIDAALFSSTDESTEQAGEPMDRNYDRSDLSPETVEAMRADCQDFLASFGAMIPEDRTEEAARDFWFTRNGHGCGFWDGDWEDAYPTDRLENETDAQWDFRKYERMFDRESTVGDFLTAMSKPYGEFNLYVGDDGQIHGS